MIAIITGSELDHIEVTSVINLMQGARPRWKFVYQMYPPANDTLVTGMSWTKESGCNSLVSGQMIGVKLNAASGEQSEI